MSYFAMKRESGMQVCLLAFVIAMRILFERSGNQNHCCKVSLSVALRIEALSFSINHTATLQALHTINFNLVDNIKANDVEKGSSIFNSPCLYCDS